LASESDLSELPRAANPYDTGLRSADWSHLRTAVKGVKPLFDRGYKKWRGPALMNYYDFIAQCRNCQFTALVQLYNHHECLLVASRVSFRMYSVDSQIQQVF